MKLRILVIEFGIKNLEVLKRELVFDFAEIIYVNSILDAFDTIILKEINTIIFSNYRGYESSLSYLKIFKTINPSIKLMTLSNEKNINISLMSDFIQMGADFFISTYDLELIKDKIYENYSHYNKENELNYNWKKCTKIVIRLLKKNYNKFGKKKLLEISLRTGYSQSAICHYVKEDTNKTISEWIKELRINGSLKLLANTNFSIKFISSQVGYKSVQGFIKAFKEIMGQTPKKFKETNNDF